MRVSELKRAMEFVIARVKEPLLIPKLNKLVNAVRQNARSPQQQIPITEEKQAVIKVIAGIVLDDLTLNEREVIAASFNLKKLGQAGTVWVNKIFTDHYLDPMGAVNELEELLQEFSGLEEQALKTLEVLEPFHVEAVDGDLEPGKAALQITFKNQAAINDFSNLRDASEQWWEIMRGISILTHTAVEKIPILVMEKGYRLQIELSSNPQVLLALGSIVDKSLWAVDRYFDMKRKAEEIRAMDLDNKKIYHELEEEAEGYKRNIVDNINAAVIEAMAGRKSNGEVSTAMEITVRHVFDFLDKGGTIDCRIPETGLPDLEKTKLATLYEKVRRLQSKIEGRKLLPKPEEKPAMA
jgi:hypothetical protein